MPPSYREEVTSIGSLVFLEIARKVKVLVKLIRKNPYACLKKNTTRVVARNADNPDITRNKAWKYLSRYEGGIFMFLFYKNQVGKTPYYIYIIAVYVR